MSATIRRNNNNNLPLLISSGYIIPSIGMLCEFYFLSFIFFHSELITNYLNRNKPALENMLAEVRSQSADDLVDGITSSEERRYSYNHYYGSRYLYITNFELILRVFTSFIFTP
jgi:hypothetical protein